MRDTCGQSATVIPSTLVTTDGSGALCGERRWQLAQLLHVALLMAGNQLDPLIDRQLAEERVRMRHAAERQAISLENGAAERLPSPIGHGPCGRFVELPGGLRRVWRIAPIDSVAHPFVHLLRQRNAVRAFCGQAALDG